MQVEKGQLEEIKEMYEATKAELDTVKDLSTASHTAKLVTTLRARVKSMVCAHAPCACRHCVFPCLGVRVPGWQCMLSCEGVCAGERARGQYWYMYIHIFTYIVH